MREFKFRAWDTVTHQMSPPFALFGEFMLLGAIFDWLREVRTESAPAGIMSILTDLEVMQYTGLKDKNGKEIYEGDIVHCSIEGDNVGNVDVIEFKNGSFWLRYRDRSIPSWIEFGNEIEVIGNIYEHSELIKRTAQTG